MEHHRNFTIAIDFDGVNVDEAFPGMGKLKKMRTDILICCMIKAVI